MPQNTLRKRFINNRLLTMISRPQYESSCSVTSLTAVFNYLYSAEVGIQTQDDIARVLGFKDASEVGNYGGPGNKTVMEWFKKLTQHYAVQGSCNIFIDRSSVKDFSNNKTVFTKIRETVESENTVIIYHMENHYNVVIGYVEAAQDQEPEKAYAESPALNRWIVLGEHSTYNRFSFIFKLLDIIEKTSLRKLIPEKIHLSEQIRLILEDKLFPSPIWCRKWKNVRKDFLDSSNHCFLIFRKQQ